MNSLQKEIGISEHFQVCLFFFFNWIFSNLMFSWSLNDSTIKLSKDCQILIIKTVTFETQIS